MRSGVFAFNPRSHLPHNLITIFVLIALSGLISLGSTVSCKCKLKLRFRFRDRSTATAVVLVAGSSSSSSSFATGGGGGSVEIRPCSVVCSWEQTP